MTRAILLFLMVVSIALVLVSGCSVLHSPVPVVVETGDASALAGVWEGSYRSADTGRSGSIHFELTAEADSAVGEVVMTYLDEGVSFFPRDPEQGPHMEAEVLTIRFVRLSADRVSGTLDPYPNPGCGCTLATTFEGVVEDGTIEGTFVARSPEHSHVQRGTWQMVRR